MIIDTGVESVVLAELGSVGATAIGAFRLTPASLEYAALPVAATSLLWGAGAEAASAASLSSVAPEV
ncbi:MAG TPA: hypothetical protein VIQ74_17855 [Gemmatimonadaceae bacterium]